MHTKCFWQAVALRAGGLALIVLAAGCSNLNQVDDRNHAIDTYYPTSNEIALAEARARAYWQTNSTRYPETRYLAVDATSVIPTEVQGLYAKLINSETTSSFFAQGFQKAGYSNVVLTCTMIYDPQTKRFVSPQGYVVVDLPSRGTTARYGPYLARYIGTGRW